MIGRRRTLIATVKTSKPAFRTRALGLWVERSEGENETRLDFQTPERYKISLLLIFESTAKIRVDINRAGS